MMSYDFIADLTPPPSLCSYSNGSAVLKTDVRSSLTNIYVRDMLHVIVVASVFYHMVDMLAIRIRVTT